MTGQRIIAMRTATVVTLFFVAATSVLGGLRNAGIASATGRPSYYLGTFVAFVMAAWCAYLGVWELSS